MLDLVLYIQYPCEDCLMDKLETGEYKRTSTDAKEIKKHQEYRAIHFIEKALYIYCFMSLL